MSDPHRPGEPDTPDLPICLVVEDQALIGMALESYLEETGLAVAGPFPSCGEALRWLEGGTPVVALLDYQLKDGSCLDLTRHLRGLDIPFLVYSGYPQPREAPPEFSGVPWLEKPVARADLLRALVRLVPSLGPQVEHATGSLNGAATLTDGFTL